ncbi:MAG TPA: tRNA (adenosine(37)-N6)-threonylcarbamoyltransferase complex dimerization subunit type 1 TsaB [Chthoniobacterales bacterium]|nr:tRNA (adenosine(37)-N6)-threonylcarbamoyltransferase complex dimerization subunit type 1 TsaB [Chthoniobacterales bacterium]
MELSSSQGSIAWRETDGESFATAFANDRKHSGLFFENLGTCLKRFGQPDRLVIGLGPGSYAGTRIALATAAGLAAASGAELAGLPSFCAMETESGDYAVIGDARRQSFYFAEVRERHCVEGPILCSAQELVGRVRDLRFPVFSTERLAQFPAAQLCYPSALLLIDLPMEIATHPLEPIYLRTPHITYPKSRPPLPATP